MPDYGEPIIIYDYIYNKPIYYTGEVVDGSDVIARLDLNSTNFNFDLLQDTGIDFRLIDSRYGPSTLKMWIAFWHKTIMQATIFFKIPDVFENSIDLMAYWGNAEAPDVSDPEDLEFIFYENFNSISLDSSKWIRWNYEEMHVDGWGYKLPYSENYHLTTKTSPLSGHNSWRVDIGLYGDFGTSVDYDTAWAMADQGLGIVFQGIENSFTIEYMYSYRINTNVELGSNNFSYTDVNYIGLNSYTYQECNISYEDFEDVVKVAWRNRSNGMEDTEVSLYRKVEGDTRLTNIDFYGTYIGYYQYRGPTPSYVSWMCIREYDQVTAILDARDLYIPYEAILPGTQDYREVLPDITNTILHHESSFGGDPYRLSNNSYSSDFDVWISDDNATQQPLVGLTIHTAWADNNLVSKGYVHYDSSHVYKYNASKLSDSDTDNMDRNFWHAESTNAWAAIKFPSQQIVGALRVKCTSDQNASPKDFILYGSNSNPIYNYSSKNKLLEGTFAYTTDWQSYILTNVGYYRYYILHVLNTQGNADIKIQEWQLMESLGRDRKSYVSQLRLSPATYSNWKFNFPKEVSLQGSVDNVNWDNLLDWTYTYTPTVQHYYGLDYWQIFSFNHNEKGYWSFRLYCRGNWGAIDGRIIIGEWELRELVEEAYTYRILAGSNDISQIWATSSCKIEDTHGIMFAANEYFNMVSNNKLISYEELPEYNDFNVV